MSRRLAPLVLAAACPWSVSAQTDRSSEDSSQGTSRAGQEETDNEGAIKRYRGRYERWKTMGIRPTIGTILPGSQLAAGIELTAPRLFGTFVGASIAGAISIRNYQQYNLHVGKIEDRTHRAELGPVDAALGSVFNDPAALTPGTGLYVHARHRIYPRVDFFGLGQSSDVDDRSDFGISGASVDLVGQWQPNRHVGVSGRIGTIDLSLREPTNSDIPDIDTRYTERTAPGLAVQRSYRVAGISATVDRRDRARRPRSGTFAGLALWHAAADDPAASGWTRLIGDVRQFVPLRPGHVLAVHALLSTRVGRTDDATPFYLQPTLGGSTTLRGFGSYRRRGDAVWAGSIEYRWQAHRWIELVPFMDLGAVANRFSRLASTTAAVSPGFGVRLTSERQVFGRIDVARSPDGTRVLLSLDAPF